MSIDSIGDFLTIIRNGTLIGKPYVVAPYSKMKHAIANILLDEGFIRDVQVATQDEMPKKSLKIVLKYVGNESVIHEITRISKPSRRLYNGRNNIKPVIGGLGLSILTTDRGLLSHKKAKEIGVGGEIICTVW